METVAGSVGALLPIIIFVFWLIRWRRHSPPKTSKPTLAPYTGLQIAGIFGILFIIAPTLLSALGYIIRIKMVLLITALGFLPLPETLHIFISTAIGTAATICFLFGTYWTCKMVWPKRPLLVSDKDGPPGC